MTLVSKRIIEKRGWMYEDVKDKKIKSVAEKCDGSIISFVKFQNGKVRAKSKMSFISEQSQMAQEVYDNSGAIRFVVDGCLRIGLTPIFELVSPENQIVLEYQNTELVLLQVRNNTTGIYVDINDLNIPEDVKVASTFNTEDDITGPIVFDSPDITLDFLLKEKETNQENIEGWVVTFEDGQMAKIKTDHYLSLHGLIGPDAFRENLLVKTILDGNIDDVIAALVPGEKKDKIIAMDEKVTHKFNQYCVEVKKLFDLFINEYNGVNKDFALANRTNPLFGIIMTLSKRDRVSEKLVEELVTAHILKQTNSLGKAKEWIEGL